ncbi:MAG: lipopolysaccharide biosynthesis protein, partial [Pseudomonadota bacterium]
MKSQILRLFVSTFSVTVLARLTQLGLASVLGRAIGSEGYGVFVYALGLAALVQQVAGLGMPPMTLRFIPSYLQENKHALAKGFLITSEIILILTTLIATLAVLGVVKFAPLRPELAAGLALGALVIMPRGLLRLRNSQSTAIKRPGTGSFWELLAPNLLTLVFAFVAHYDAARPIVQFYAAAAVISFALATVGVYRRLWPRVGEKSATFETGTWLKAGVPAMLSIAARNMINRVDIVLIAPLSNMQQVGLFGVSSQLSNLLTFPQFILNSVMAPRYSESYTS